VDAEKCEPTGGGRKKRGEIHWIWDIVQKWTRGVRRPIRDLKPGEKAGGEGGSEQSEPMTGARP